MSFPNLLFPLDDLQLESVTTTDAHLSIVAASTQASAACPACQTLSRRVHSRYHRTVADLPVTTRRLVFHLHVRRFFCDHQPCSKRTFAEPFGTALPRYARCTARLTDALRALAFAAGGEGGARLAHQLALPLSPRTALRLLHGYVVPPSPPPRVVGMDDWAWKKGRNYGTICIDLERHQPIDLLPDREPTTIAAWLQAHPGIEIIARDRGRDFIEGIRHGAPQAIQVADRWHLLKNLGDALEYFFHQQRNALRTVSSDLNAKTAAAAGGQRPVPITDGTTISLRAQAPRKTRSAHTQERFEFIQRLHAEQMEIANIARFLKLSRVTVSRYLRMAEAPTSSPAHIRERHVVDPWRSTIIEYWNGGCRNGLQIWRELRDKHDYPYSPRTVARFVALLRQDSGTPGSYRSVDAQPLYGAATTQYRPLSALLAARLWCADAATHTCGKQLTTERCVPTIRSWQQAMHLRSNLSRSYVSGAAQHSMRGSKQWKRAKLPHFATLSKG